MFIREFNGIIFEMRADKAFFPSVYARYRDDRGRFSLETGEIMDGSLPIEQKKIVAGWILLNQEELMNNWKCLSMYSKTK